MISLSVGSCIFQEGQCSTYTNQNHIILVLQGEGAVIVINIHCILCTQFVFFNLYNNPGVRLFHIPTLLLPKMSSVAAYPELLIVSIINQDLNPYLSESFHLLYHSCFKDCLRCHLAVGETELREVKWVAQGQVSHLMIKKGLETSSTNASSCYFHKSKWMNNVVAYQFYKMIKRLTRFWNWVSPVP